MSKKKIIKLVLLLSMATAITLATASIGRFGAEYTCFNHGDTQVLDMRGIPFTYVQRSTVLSGCEPYYIKGGNVPNPGKPNFYIQNFLLDIAIWALVLFVFYQASLFVDKKFKPKQNSRKM